MYKNLKSIILVAILVIFSTNPVLSVDSNQNIYKTGISMVEKLPTVFFGTWRVASDLISTDSPSTFKKHNVDIWNLSKKDNVVNLSNPFSGAKASLTLDYAEQNTIRFSKKHNYDGKILTDTVEIKLDGEKFSGENIIILDTLSDIDKSIIKTQQATYSLKGEKIAGESIIKGE